MHKQLTSALALVLITLFATACGSTSDSADTSTAASTTAVEATVAPVNANAHPSCSADVVTTTGPNTFDGNNFDRYYELVIDDQVAMRYLFQPSLSPAQVEHVVRTTRWYLTNVAGSTYGADKSAVIAALASNNATMVIPDGSHVEGQDLGVRGQELYSNEIAAPGSAWYVTNDEEHRDATLEEVFHQVHDAGIGTYLPGALPDYQTALLAEAEIAKDDGRWASDSPEWVAELAQEGSLAQEYIASVIDNYYGLWAYQSDGSGYYAYNDRASVTANDPAGTQLLQQFLGDVVEIEAYLDPTFNGTFTLAKSDDAPYSHKSQYLRGARLTGTNPSGITGNDLDNTLRGNTADNALDGGAGDDVAIYCSGAARYSISTADGKTTITGPDGADTLVNIETVHFADGSQAIGS